MTSALKPYPSYKPSGVPWLGDVPGHWQTRRLKYLLRERDSRSADGREQLLRVSQYTGVTQRFSLDGSEEPDTRAATLVGYRRVHANELVVNIMLAWNGSMGVSRYDGIVSPAYCVYRFVSNVDPWYFHHLLRSPTYKAHIKTVSTGVVESRLRLYSDDLYRIETLLPPPPEQSAIARYLDHVDRRIRKYIRAKQRLIGLLNEQKQAIIQEVVTRGPDPSVELKPSGVPWLGNVPKHWGVVAARHLFRAVTRRDTRGDEVKLSVTQKHGLVPTEEMEENSTQAVSYDRFQVCHPGDLVLNKYKAHLGVFWAAERRGLITPNYTVFQPVQTLVTKYFELLFHMPTYRDAFSMMVYGVTEGMSPLYTQDFYRVAALRPSFAEQEEIVRHVADQTMTQDAAIERVGREIAVLSEYRTRLVADVVTGKLDVREAAASLPEESDEVEEPELLAEEEPEEAEETVGVDTEGAD